MIKVTKLLLIRFADWDIGGFNESRYFYLNDWENIRNGTKSVQNARPYPWNNKNAYRKLTTLVGNTEEGKDILSLTRWQCQCSLYHFFQTMNTEIHRKYPFLKISDDTSFGDSHLLFITTVKDYEFRQEHGTSRKILMREGFTCLNQQSKR